MRRVGTLLTLLSGASATLWAQSRPVVPPTAEAPASQPRSRDEALWLEICGLDRQVALTKPFPDNVAAALQARRRLLEKARLYLSAYPGGPRRDEVVPLELRTLFEIATLSAGAYGPLQERVAAYLRHPPSDAALYEAAYWAIHCRRLARASAGSQPSSAPVTRLDADLLDAYRAYIERYPRSRYVPRMATLLFEAAAGRGDEDAMRQLVTQLGRDFPRHAVTELLAAQLRRGEAVGRPFALAFEAAGGTQVDTAAWKGRPVLVVVWAGFSAPARLCVARIEAFRRERPELHVVGINLDESEERMNAVCAELGLAWPQFNDGMGWANRFALGWGIRTLPQVFVVDRQGRLAGSSGAAGWRELAAAVLEN
jgi:hypothetical protein